MAGGCAKTKNIALLQLRRWGRLGETVSQCNNKDIMCKNNTYMHSHGRLRGGYYKDTHPSILAKAPSITSQSDGTATLP